MIRTRAFSTTLILIGALAAILAASRRASGLDAAPRMVGGFTKQDVSKPEYKRLTRTAEELVNGKTPDRKFRILMLREVHTQVVAGMNYKLLCDYKDANGRGQTELVLYRDLAGDLSLTRDSSQEEEKRFTYKTTFGGTLLVEFLPDDLASISYGTTRLVLPRAISGSGARYSKDGVTFWIKGDDATFENEKTGEKVNCSVQ